MKNIFKKTQGSFLADIMVSMGILTMSIAASLTIINQSIHTNSVNKNKIIAVNLAREGLEGMRIIRDTNWLRYGTKKRICWNFWNNTDQDDEWKNGEDAICQELNSPDDGRNQHPIGVTNEEIGIKSYILTLDETNYNWILVENFKLIPSSGSLTPEDRLLTCKASDFENNEALTKEDECLGDPGEDVEGKWKDRKSIVYINSRLYLDSVTGLYTHTPTGNTPTDFYREVFIEYPLVTDGFHPLLSTGDNQTIKRTDNQIFIAINVWYKGHGGIMRKVTLETELTDYLERENWSD